MEPLKISVIIPSFNQGRYIEETLISLEKQNYIPLEIIVIDGGSTDDTLSVIKKYAEKITYWVSEPDKGQSDAINKGFLKATGDIITWLNSDDYYNPSTLSSVADFFLKNKEVDLLHGRARLFGNGKEKVIGPDAPLKLYEYFPYMRFPQPSSFFRKKLIDEFGPIKNEFHYTMDFEFVCRILLGGKRIQSVNTVFSNYRLHKDSKTNHSQKFLDEWAHIVTSVLSAFDQGKQWAQMMGDLKLNGNKKIQNFAVNISLSPHDLRNIFLLHLNLQYHTLYQQMDFKKALTISNYLREFHPDFYKKEKIGKFDKRAKYVPRLFFKLLR